MRKKGRTTEQASCTVFISGLLPRAVRLDKIHTEYSGSSRLHAALAQPLVLLYEVLHRLLQRSLLLLQCLHLLLERVQMALLAVPRELRTLTVLQEPTLLLEEALLLRRQRGRVPAEQAGCSLAPGPAKAPSVASLWPAIIFVTECVT